ncbi:MAG: glycosyltransferase family 4 protein [Deltaproteobacteria bacterium]|nr:glycosyltransferase family 4 protein [Deltaproteobacteria bacterium]
MRVLVITQQFPNAAEPLASPFNRQMVAALARRCPVQVLAPIPWYPGARQLSRWSQAGRLLQVPAREVIDGLEVHHPRFLHPPRMGRRWAGWLYARSLAGEVRRRRGSFDVLFSSWAYPDGHAAVLLARQSGVPAVVKVSGSDINVVGRLPGVEQNLRRTLPQAGRIVAVSRPLGEAVAALGVARERIEVITNGVDQALFHPRDRQEARAALGHGGDTRSWCLYVGRLEPVKGVAELLEAFGRLARSRADVRLAIVGDGSLRQACARSAASLGDRVLLAGSQPLEAVPRWMAASDLLVLPSRAEGTPNVALEALACGRRVVATRVGGTPDVITGPELGELVAPGDPEALARALSGALGQAYVPEEVARAGARHGWDESARRLEAALQGALA